MKIIRKACHVRQHGVAMTMFLVMIPVLTGFMVLSVEGGRYLRAKASLGDAAEVATLAISSGENPDNTYNKELATRYMETLMPEATVKSVKISHRVCIPPECDIEAEHSHSGFVEYSAEMSVAIKSLFPSMGENGLGFKKIVDVKTDATVRKFRGGALDVVFVADFSGSMRDHWDGERKINMLKDVMGKVAAKVEDYTASEDEKNTMAFIPFHVYTFEGFSGSGNNRRYCATTQWVGGTEDSDTNSENAEKTINALFDPKECDNPEFESKDNEHFYSSTELMTVAKKLTDTIDEMTAGWGTAVFEGIIRASQIVKTGKNPRRLIIVLSDGEDSGFYDVIGFSPKARHNLLIDKSNNFQNNYCHKIRDTLNQERTEDGVQVQSRIAVIGFDYDIEKNTQLRDCAGANNVYSAQNIDDFYKLIIGLISEEIGHLHQNSAG